MPVVDIKLGTSLVNTYDGSPENLSAFLDAVALFSDTVDADFAAATAEQKNAARATVVRFIKTRLTGVARQAIGELNEINQIIQAIKTRCATTITSDNILAKLKNLKQQSNCENFCASVEKLTNNLRDAYISERIPTEVADKMSTKSGVEALINGTKSHEAKLILKAGSFVKINDAVQKLQENDSSESINPKQIFHVSHRGRGRNTTNHRGQNGRGYGPRGRNTYNNSGRYNNYNNYNQYNNGYRNSNNRRGRGYQQPYHQNQGPGRQIFYNNQGNFQGPQQQQQQMGGLNANQQMQQQPMQLAQLAQQRQ